MTFVLVGGKKGEGERKKEIGRILKPFCAAGIKQTQKKKGDKIGLDC